MVKWADFGISAVRYNTAHTHIDKVIIHVLNVGTIGASKEQSRQNIISAIKKSVTFVTILKKAGEWVKGQPVFIVKINGTEYIKTVENNKETDNLENLPEF